MSAKINQFRLDIQEAKTFLASATRPRIKDLLSSEIKKLEHEVKELEANIEKDAPKKEVSRPCINTTIRNYSWDQSDKFMKLYITLNGVQHLDKDLITCNFTNCGLTFKVNNLDGRNYELAISEFAHRIDSEKSYYKVKNDMVVIFAAKVKLGTWDAVLAEERRAIEAKKLKSNAEKPDDPSASIHGLMKQMYEDGDDKMKQMLNKTWYETQMKTQRGGGGAGEMGMGGLGDLNDLNI